MEVSLRVSVVVRTLLRRTLPPRAFAFVRLHWRYLLFASQIFFSWFVTRAPEVDGFGGGSGTPDLLKTIRSVNALAPTRMCRAMMRHGSDKGYPSQCITTVYSALFKGLRNQPLRVFELGLGSNNPQMPSNMGVNGIPGASLRGWREIFPCAQVFGADIDREILFQEHQIKTFYCDQLCQQSISDLWSHPDLQGGADIIIEDGLHTFEANISFLEGSLEHLRPGGFYVIEDICQDDAGRWHTQFETVYSKRFPACEFVLVTLPAHPGETYNNLLVIRRGVE